MKTIAIVGFGSRGQMFARLLAKEENKAQAKLVAIAEPIAYSRNRGITEYGIPEAFCFATADAFFEKGKICDAVFICTQDKQHCEMVLRALELGYDVLLEKPAGVSLEECVAIRDKANELGRKVMLTHVLRYAPFYQVIKKVIASGELGNVVAIDQTENIAYWHFALSFVRGPWRNVKESTPSIIAKCCHDLDIIKWLMDKKCTHISSFGRLFYFNPENAPQGSAEYCVDCDKTVKENCIYNAYKIYPQRMKRAVVGGMARLNADNIMDMLDNKQDRIAKCIYHSGNDALDNQVVNMQFEDGSTAHLTMTAFSAECHRNIQVHGTKGEIYGDLEDGLLTLNVYGQPSKKIDPQSLNVDGVNLDGGHGGGDYYLLKDFLDYITCNTSSFTRTTIDDSIESHIMGFKAEESRLQNGKVMKLEV